MTADTFPITDFGATGNGLDTEAVQDAIDACADAGGGTVHVPPGEYRVGALALRSDVTVHLAAGATLSVSTDEDQFGLPGDSPGPDGELPFVLAKDVENVALTGRGTIDGNGTEVMLMDEPLRGHHGDRGGLVAEVDPDPRQDDFLDQSTGFESWPVAKPEFRPGPMFRFEGCTNVAVEGVTIRDMPHHTISLRNCEEVDVRGVDILNHLRIPNCDGIAIHNSRNVHVSDCSIRSADDCITPTARADGPPTENVTVTNCTLRTNDCAVKVGSTTGGDVRSLTVSNCTIEASNRGVGIQHRDGGDVEDVLFSDLVIETRLVGGPWWGKGEPVYITAVPRREDTDAGAVRNVTVSNVVADAEGPITVYAHDDARVEDVTLRGVRTTVSGGEFAADVGGNLDLQPTSVLAPIFEHPISGTYARGVEGLRLRDVQVEWGEDRPEYLAHGLHCEDCSGVTVDGFEGSGASGDRAALRLDATDVVSVRGSMARPETGTFLACEDVADARLFAGNDLADADRMGDVDGFTVGMNVEPR